MTDQKPKPNPPVDTIDADLDETIIRELECLHACLTRIGELLGVEIRPLPERMGKVQ